MIYAIRAVGTEFVKFGIAANVDRRLRHLQTGCPLELELVASCWGGRLEEMTIHMRLVRAKAYHRGEWFRMCPEAEKIIEEMRAHKLVARPDANANVLRLEHRHKRLGAVLEFARKSA